MAEKDARVFIPINSPVTPDLTVVTEVLVAMSFSWAVTAYKPFSIIDLNSTIKLLTAVMPAAKVKKEETGSTASSAFL